MVASVCARHEHHERAAAELERRFAKREAMIVAAPALVEAYAVLTRLPPPIVFRRPTHLPSWRPTLSMRHGSSPWT